jgi:hypothetical protein
MTSGRATAGSGNVVLNSATKCSRADVIPRETSSSTSTATLPATV